LELDVVSDPIAQILMVETWEGSGGIPSVIYVEHNKNKTEQDAALKAQE